MLKSWFDINYLPNELKAQHIICKKRKPRALNFLLKQNIFKILFNKRFVQQITIQAIIVKKLNPKTEISMVQISFGTLPHWRLNYSVISNDCQN